MRSIPFLVAAGAALLAVLPVAAAELRARPKAVVELFTSQGCASCPQADAVFNELGKRGDVIALAWHVNYWDYIGWNDTFGTEANSNRQRDYAQSWGSAGVYTPQVIINGQHGMNGSSKQDVSKAIDGAALGLPVALNVKPDMLEVDIAPQSGGQDAMVWLVTFKDRSQVKIERGENAGKMFDYTQIVTSKQMLGMWDAATGTHLKLPLSALTEGDSNGAAILVQADKNGLPGPILGAASVQL